MKQSGITAMKQMANGEAVAWNAGPEVLLSGYSGSDPRGIGPYEYHMDGATFHLGSVPLGECDLASIIRKAEKPFFLSVFAGTAAGNVATRISRSASELREALPDVKLRFVTPSQAREVYLKLRGEEKA